MDYEIRPVTLDEFKTYGRATGAAFSEQLSDDDFEGWKLTFEPERSLAAFDEREIVGTAGAFTFDLTLPGLTTIPVAGVTAVGVLPTHRRQGILTEMMRRQLDDVQARGEPVAVLMASESAIYGRYGYGIATSTATYEIERRHAAFARRWELPGRVRMISHEDALHALPPLYDQVRRRQPGALNRSQAKWESLLRNPEKPLGAEGPRFYGAYTSDAGDTEGVVQYRVKSQWEGGLHTSVLVTREFIALTTEANAALWQFLFGVDLIQTVQAVNRPVDEPLRWMLADSRRLRVTRLTDDLWVRLLDIPTALAARRYASTGRVVFEVSDAFRPEQAGRYVLEGGPEGAECRATDATADLTLDVVDLGAAYLGGVRFATLARAGRVVAQTPDVLARADAMFASEPAPWCATPF
ncbi:MAG: GNAT family N-acetyltransferase [Ktedonobacterales bacterium]